MLFVLMIQHWLKISSIAINECFHDQHKCKAKTNILDLGLGSGGGQRELHPVMSFSTFQTLKSKTDYTKTCVSCLW